MAFSSSTAAAVMRTRFFSLTIVCVALTHNVTARAQSSSRHSTQPPGQSTTLIPNTPGVTPSYWCTWGTQEYAPYGYEDDSAGGNLNEQLLFGPHGWATTAFPAARSDLYLLLDNGWNGLGSAAVEPDKNRFPSLTGTPVERLRTLNDRAKALGWKGIGVWLVASRYGAQQSKTDSASEAYWRERARWSRDAGVHYWKIDWGPSSKDLRFRAWLTRIAHAEDPGLVVEHAVPSGPLDGNFLDTGATGGMTPVDLGTAAAPLLAAGGVFRIYDVITYLSVPTTLGRESAYLQAGRAVGGSAILNSEDEVYLGAVLGNAIGMLRGPAWLDGQAPGHAFDPRHTKYRMDEVTRAVHWQRVAPAFSVGSTSVAVDSAQLADSWRFRHGDTWLHDVDGHLVGQRGPARLARGMPLPEVIMPKGHANAAPPYVVASRHPNGAISVATLPRISPDSGQWTPLADVTLDAGDAKMPIGVFGVYDALTLRLNHRLGTKHVLAQDLAGGPVRDITRQVHIRGAAITIPGPLLHRIGLLAASAGDLSDPGAILVIR